MPGPDEYPRELLAQPRAARLTYFENKIVAHPKLMRARDELWHAIHHPAGASLIFVLGPTGVGKTTLRQRIEKQLLEEALPGLTQDPSRIPVVGLEAVAPESGNFNWKDYYIRALSALDEPLAASKIDYGVRDIRPTSEGRLTSPGHVTIAGLRQALERCLRQRRPTAFIVDEAQHFKKIASGRRLLDQMDTIKSLAGTTGTVHVLVGTYELLDLTNLSAQLSRRSIDIHFPRYRPDSDEDVGAFKNVLLTFQRHLPLLEEPDLVAHYDYFYERSIGCVGVLKDWLHRALAAALEDDQATLPHQYLDQYAEPTHKLLRMAREIKEGEAPLAEMEGRRTELRVLLGMDVEPTQVSTKKQPSKSTASNRRTGPVGQRHPTRDPVGEHVHGE